MKYVEPETRDANLYSLFFPHIRMHVNLGTYEELAKKGGEGGGGGGGGGDGYHRMIGFN